MPKKQNDKKSKNGSTRQIPAAIVQFAELIGKLAARRDYKREVEERKRPKPNPHPKDSDLDD
ncbi:hypothetical protein D1224_03375 [Henriciella barbarensis]|uniref:Uncharacterized protein n=1 Tax=Henriciella barbarensis TaxID=86342 RepID=A0A399QXU6_9PROT|nr:hypothetical protein [Henriciella barbarensis]RIJ23331.1 hypothetical protein D1224_03375 [Henriciella barbarensis]